MFYINFYLDWFLFFIKLKQERILYKSYHICSIECLHISFIKIIFKITFFYSIFNQIATFCLHNEHFKKIEKKIAAINL